MEIMLCEIAGEKQNTRTITNQFCKITKTPIGLKKGGRIQLESNININTHIGTHTNIALKEILGYSR